MTTSIESSFEVVSLRDFTTLRMGGEAKLFRPQTHAELVYLLERFRQRREDCHILGNGSNLLVNDAQMSTPVLHTGALREVRVTGEYVEVDAGCLLAKLIRVAQDNNLGGIEYLVSVPGTVGGAICMNAGRGARTPQFFHQVVESVTCFDGKRIWNFPRSELLTGFRWSRFRESPELCIISARLKLLPRSRDEIKRRIAARLELTRNREDHTGPNAGSVFRVTKDFSAFRGTRNGDAHFSNKTPNWIVNQGATFQQILDLIRSVGTDSELEWDVWHG